MIFVALTPHGFGLRFDAGDGIEQADSAVEHAHGTFDFDREIDVARRVDDVDAVIVPEAGRRSRRDRDAAFLFLFHLIHRRGAFMHFADFVGFTGVIQNAFGRRRLTSIDVSHDADVTILFDGRLTRHK